MHLRVVLPAFALLLAVSTASSFVGYKYLSLASEYRERNFIHLSETYSLIELLESASIMRRPQIADAIDHLDVTKAQVEWCLAVLSPFEQWMFVQLGAAGAFDLCALGIQVSQQAKDVLYEMEAAYETTGATHPDAFALNLRARDHARYLLDESLKFHPYVSIIEDQLKAAVRAGTAITALGLAVAFLLIARDLVKSQRVQHQQTRALEKQTQELSELAAIAERANDSIILADTEGLVTWVNPAFERVTGFSLEDAKGKKPGSFLQGPDTNPETIREIGAALSANRPVKRDILNYSKDGDSYWVSLSISALETEDGEHYGFVAISSDITREVEQREAIDAANREIEHRSLHDPLTNLPNRRALDDAIRERINKELPTTLVRIDLDHFKYVNDTMGHEAGDFVLQQVAQILWGETREDDLPARVGGDEFVIMLSSGKTTEHGRMLAERILLRIKQPMVFEGKLVRVGGSFGVASTLEKLLTVEELAVGADAALYEAKEYGRNRVHLYTPELHTQIEDRRKMARELKRAVADEEFIPYYQPQFDAKSRKLIGVETLARWDSSALGFVMPDEFLPVAQRLSIVEEIDDIIFRRAVAEITDLRELGVGIDKLSLNVTAHRVYDPNVVRMVQETNTSTLKIAFEVLESVLVEDQGDMFRFGIDALREAGVSIEVDDFGCGHASIIGLMQLQPDAMKIDRRLVQNINIQKKTERSSKTSSISPRAWISLWLQKASRPSSKQKFWPRSAVMFCKVTHSRNLCLQMHLGSSRQADHVGRLRKAEPVLFSTWRRFKAHFRPKQSYEPFAAEPRSDRRANMKDQPTAG